MVAGSASILQFPRTHELEGLRAIVPDSTQSFIGTKPLRSPEYTSQAKPSCFWLLRQLTRWARAFAVDKAGSNNAARMPIMAITTSNSTKVNPLPHLGFIVDQTPRPVVCFTEPHSTREESANPPWRLLLYDICPPTGKK